MALDLPSDAPPPRLCVLVKNAATDEYGYNLHAEKGKQQFIGTVDDNSPASRAGLCPGDFIYAVNGQSIVGESHRQVVQKIKEFPLKCELLVISEAGAEWYKEHDIPITVSLPNIIRVSKEEDAVNELKKEADSGSPTPATWYTPKEAEKGTNAAVSPIEGNEMLAMPRPRLCTLIKKKPEDEFGFNLHAEKGRGHFVGAVDKGGIGERSGLCIGQRIVGVNGKLIYPSTPHRDVVALIKENPLVTELLVASEEVDRWYTMNHTDYSFKNCEVIPTGRLMTRMESSGDSSITQEQVSESLSRSPEMVPAEVTPVNAIITDSSYDDKQYHSDRESEPNEEMMSKTMELPVEPMGDHVTKKADYDPSPRTSLVDNVIKANQSVISQQNSHEKNGSVAANGVDIFSLSAEEARHRLVHRKRDPRLDTNMSIEEKHRLISNM